MIKTFSHKGLEDLFYDGIKKGVQTQQVDKLLLILDRLDAAVRKEDMQYPGSGYHRLKGTLKDFYAVKVSGNWRIIFRFKDGDAYDVDYMDYH